MSQCDFSGSVWEGRAASAFFSWDACSAGSGPPWWRLPPLRKPCWKGLLVTAPLRFQQQPASTASYVDRPAWVSPKAVWQQSSQDLPELVTHKIVKKDRFKQIGFWFTPLSFRVICLTVPMGKHFLPFDTPPHHFSCPLSLLSVCAVVALIHFSLGWSFHTLHIYTHHIGTVTLIHTKSITWLSFTPQIASFKPHFSAEKTWVCRD